MPFNTVKDISQQHQFLKVYFKFFTNEHATFTILTMEMSITEIHITKNELFYLITLLIQIHFNNLMVIYMNVINTSS